MSLSESLDSLRKIDLADLDFENAGSWPAPIKAITGIILLASYFGIFGKNWPN